MNNQVAPVVPLTSVSSNSRFLFNLYSTYLTLSPLSVNNADLSSFVSVFPNPFKDQVTVVIAKQNVKQVSINIRNIVGHVVYTNTAIASGNKTIELSNLSSGIYLMEIIIDGERVMKKIIKQ